MNKRKIIIDTDPGIDDAVAIALALNSDELDVRLFTTVAGNVSIEKVTKNLLKLLTYYKRKVPVAMGAKQPLLRPIIDASGVHGKTGMDGFEFPKEDESLLMPIGAVDAIYKCLKENDGNITLVTIGPLTNIALLLRTYPDAIKYIAEIVLMGGSINRGNYGVYSEFNFHADPEAAKIVFESGIKITMCGLDVGLKALVYPHESEIIKNMNATGYMFYSLFKTYRGGSFNTGLKMYDSCAIAYLVKPEMFTVNKYFVGIETKGEFTSGASVVDLKNKLNREPNIYVAEDIDTDIFKDWFLETIKKCS